MNYHSPGVLDNSTIYLYNANRKTRDIFYYLLCIGHYFCTGEYTVSRQRYDSFLIIYVADGEGQVVCGDKLQTVEKGSFIFIDCYTEHSYLTRKGWEILWMHVDGQNMRQLFDIITDHGRKPVITPPNPYGIERNMNQIYELFDRRQRISDARISQCITNVLTEFYITRTHSESNDRANTMEDILTYIAMHIDQPLSVDDLAEHVHLSPFHFSRLFKQNTGFSPHAYIMNYRMNNAKYLLGTTDFSVKRIALCCGYANVGTFCTNFRKKIGKSPLDYRRELGERP